MPAILIAIAAALGAAIATKGITVFFSWVLANSRSITMVIFAVGVFLIMANHQLGKKIAVGAITAYILLKVVAS